MTVTSIHTREVEKAENDHFVQAGLEMDSAEVEANARHAADLTAAYKDAMLNLINRTGRLCNHIDSKDEMQRVIDALQDLGGDTFDCWNDYADRMRRGS